MVSVDPSAIRFLQHNPQLEDKQAAQSGDVVTAQASNQEAAHVEGEEATQPEDKESAPKPRTKEGVEGQPWTKDPSLTPFVLPDYAAPFIFIPAYIEPSFATCSAIYVRHPTARPGYSEIPTPYEADGEVVRLAWEWYAKRRSRMRSRSQLESMPDNRKTRE